MDSVSENNGNRRIGLTRLTLQNFKGIGPEPVSIPLRPITLLFGTNASGKSTILHALLYAREALERQNLDPDVTLAGGTAVDLGGFYNLVHRHLYCDGFRIRLDFEIDDDGLPPVRTDPELMQVDVNGLVDITSAWIDMKIEKEGPGEPIRNSEFIIGLNGFEFAQIWCTSTYPYLSQVNWKHPLWASLADDADASSEGVASSWLSELHDLLCACGIAQEEFVEDGSVVVEIPLEEGYWAIPSLDDPIPILASEFTDRFSEEIPQHLKEFDAIVNQVVLGVVRSAVKELGEIRYLGPVRQLPARNYVPPKYPDESFWAGGLGAWDLLYSDPYELNMSKISAYLNRTDQLNLGYTLRVDESVEMKFNDPAMLALKRLRAEYEELGSQFVRDQILEVIEDIPRRSAVILHDEQNNLDVSPQDIGVGVSQVLPVIVGAVDKTKRVLAVEQPELHLHPAAQCALGDLLAHEFLDGDRMCLIETHSEHLILRLLRRIREKYEGELPPDAPELSPADISVIWMERTAEGTIATELKITDDGDFEDEWPQGFFEERAEELF